MRIFKTIVQSIKEPDDKNVMWLKDGVLMYYENGQWVSIKAFSV